MKQKQQGKICFIIYIAGERKLFFFIYEVFVKQKKENALLITTKMQTRVTCVCPVLERSDASPR
jgi:hypothetical protein